MPADRLSTSILEDMKKQDVEWWKQAIYYMSNGVDTKIDYFYLIHYAVITNRCDIINYLLSENGMIDVETQKGRSTAFLLACMLEKENAMKTLLNSGANILTQDKDRDNCLHISLHGSLKITKILLSEPNNKQYLKDLFYQKNIYGKTPYEMSLNKSSAYNLINHYFGFCEEFQDDKCKMSKSECPKLHILTEGL
ncbi:ankyrin repeat domain-containing protein [bacterium]|nr:MAG: ankyrin repeat domain-containing protein [bacterium]